MSGRRVRWVCPEGLHAGVLGSSRPPSDSLVRFCLPCSQERGRLVARVAPALVRKREAAAEAARGKAKAKRARAAVARERAAEREAARFVVDGLDMREELRRLVRLRAFGGPRGRLALRLPEFSVTHRAEKPRTRLGFAWPGEWRFHMTVWPGMDSADARETLVHELTHLVVGGDPDDRLRWHGVRFREVFRAAFREAYGPDIVQVENVYHGRHSQALRERAAEAVAQ